MSYRATNSDLKHIYKYYNKKYFGNKLPKDIKIRFKDISDLGRTLFDTDTKEPKIVEIDSEYRTCAAVGRLTLLHEMVHVENIKKRGHGKWFDKRMLQLAKQGAFNGLW
jgi:hypothetical protein